MGQYMKTYLETDKIGTHKVIEYPNGRKVRILKQPSEWYKQKQEASREKMLAKKAEEQIAHDREKLIKDKMRELAIAELQKEGKL